VSWVLLVLWKEPSQWSFSINELSWHNQSAETSYSSAKQTCYVSRSDCIEWVLFEVFSYSHILKTKLTHGSLFNSIKHFSLLLGRYAPSVSFLNHIKPQLFQKIVEKNEMDVWRISKIRPFFFCFNSQENRSVSTVLPTRFFNEKKTCNTIFSRAWFIEVSIYGCISFCFNFSWSSSKGFGDSH